MSLLNFVEFLHKLVRAVGEVEPKSCLNWHNYESLNRKQRIRSSRIAIVVRQKPKRKDASIGCCYYCDGNINFKIRLCYLTSEIRLTEQVSKLHYHECHHQDNWVERSSGKGSQIVSYDRVAWLFVVLKELPWKLSNSSDNDAKSEDVKHDEEVAMVFVALLTDDVLFRVSGC